MSGRLQSASLFLNANPIVAWNFVADILRYERVQKEDLTSVRVSRMLNLMRASYDDVTLERFVRDLSWKDEVILLLDDACEIQGFSTLALNPRGTGRDNYDILYSGDTIIGPDHWGSQELVRGFCETAGQIRAKRRKTLYWYLLSKGYRTYLYLPLFTQVHFPSPQAAATAPHLAAIVDRCSRQVFGEAWKPDLGVLQFEENVGKLNSELANDFHKRSHNPHVEYFLDRNPGFWRGDELVCLAELSCENTRRIAGRHFRAGMKLAAEQTIGTEPVER